MKEIVKIDKRTALDRIPEWKLRPYTVVAVFKTDMARLKAIRQEHGFTANYDAIRFLIDYYEKQKKKQD